jgi:hypothetical protein
LSALLERFRSPGRKAWRDAGPPERFVIVGFVLSTALVIIGWLSGVLRDVPWPLWAVIPASVLTLISAADRDGWNIRRAMAYVAIQQRARWTRGPLPDTPTRAQAWLDDPVNTDASDLEKASILITSGNRAAGGALLDSYVPETAMQTASVARLRCYLRALETGSMDMDHVYAASDGLSADDRRYQLTSAAWMQAWMDIEAHRPWRWRFAAAVRDLGPYPVPGRALAFIGFQELAAPIATVLATVLVAIAGAVLR